MKKADLPYRLVKVTFVEGQRVVRPKAARLFSLVVHKQHAETDDFFYTADPFTHSSIATTTRSRKHPNTMAPRKTRAAAKAKTETVEPVGEGQNLATITPDERDQLRSITPNSAGSGEEDQPVEGEMPKPKAKKSKKGAGRKKAKKGTSDSPLDAPQQDAPETVEQEGTDTPLAQQDEYAATAPPAAPVAEVNEKPIGA
jgi:hypothetical protein